MDWRSKVFWTRVGYTLTAIWILGILYATDGEIEDPLFDYIFIVPLGTWMVGLAIARVMRRRK